MGDAIHDNVPALAGVSGLQLVAGYATGTPDIQWTSADWATFSSLVEVTIDQGYTGSPVASAVVRDVETGAWSAGNAVDLTGWTPAGPTIYCNQSTLPSVVAAGWQGDLWLAILTSQPPSSPPVVNAPGCTVVAQQYAQGVGGAYDLSIVFDPVWPEVAAVEPQALMNPGWLWCNKCQGIFYGPNQAVSVCPAGGQHNPQADTGSLSYSIPYAQ
jgi:hypothetical protein